MQNVKSFCYGALAFEKDEDIGIISVERARSAPKGKAYMEVIVSFKDSNARDIALARGPYLAEYRDQDNKPTCGIRLHIPPHLMTAFKTLESYGYYLKNEHREDIRKYIKFDEYDETLFLQVKHAKDDEWLTFTPEQAKRELYQKNEKRVQKSHLHRSPAWKGREFVEATRRLNRSSGGAEGGNGGGVGRGWSGATGGFGRGPGGAAGSGGDGKKRREEDRIDEMETGEEYQSKRTWNPPPRTGQF